MREFLRIKPVPLTYTLNMKFILRLITGAVTAAMTLNPLPSLPSTTEITPHEIQHELPFINNGSLILYSPNNSHNMPTISAIPTPEPTTPTPTIPTPAPEPTGLDIIEKTFKSGGINNQTSINLPKNISRDLPFDIIADSELPQVLIYHTHTTEAFIGEENFRSLDESKNIIAVGAKIAEELAAAGFAVIHNTTVHDHPRYSGSYKRSAETVQAILNEYPSIKVVLDVHRDAIEIDDTPVAAIADIDGKRPAQIMIVAPADNEDGDWEVPYFMYNFRFAHHLQNQLHLDHKGLPRPILFQYSNYNLHLSTGSLLIEIGSHGNTLEQALYAAELFGQSLGKLLSIHS